MLASLRAVEGRIAECEDATVRGNEPITLAGRRCRHADDRLIGRLATFGAPTDFALVLVAAAIILVVAYVFLRASARLARLLGQTGINVFTRILGLLLAALAVQYVAGGVVELMLSLGA
jgi:hypothetical protein